MVQQGLQCSEPASKPAYMSLAPTCHMTACLENFCHAKRGIGAWPGIRVFLGCRSLGGICIWLNGFCMCRHKSTGSPSKAAMALEIMEDVDNEPDLMIFTPAAAGTEADADAVSSQSPIIGQEVGTCKKNDGKQPWWTRRLWMR